MPRCHPTKTGVTMIEKLNAGISTMAPDTHEASGCVHGCPKPARPNGCVLAIDEKADPACACAVARRK